MKKKAFSYTLRISIYSAIVLFIAGIGTYNYLSNRFSPEKIQKILVQKFSDFLDQPIQIEKVEWSFLPRPAMVGHNIHIVSKDHEVVMQAPEVRFYILPWSLTRNNPVVYETVFVNPQIEYKLKQYKESNIQDFFIQLKKRKEKISDNKSKKLLFEKFSVQKGELTLIDELKSLGIKPGVLIVNGSGKIHSEDSQFRFNLVAKGTSEKPLGFWQINGELGSTVLIKGDVKQLPVTALSPYWSKWNLLSGLANITGSYYREPGKKPEWLWKGEVPSLKYKDHDIPVTSHVSWFHGSDRPLELKVKAKSKKSTAEIETFIPTFSTQTISFSFRSPQFHLYDVLSWSKPLLQSTSTLNSEFSFLARGEAVIGYGEIGDFDFSDFKSIVTVSTGQWKFEHMSGLAMEGEVKGSLNVSLFKKSLNKNPWIKFSGKIEDILAEELFGLWQSTPIIYGPMDIRGQMEGPSAKNFVDEAQGLVFFKVYEGKLSRFPSILKIVSRLNLKSVFTTDENSRDKGRFAFDTLSGDLKFNNGTIYSENLRLDSEKITIEAKGHMNTVENTVDAGVSVQALTVMDEFLKHIPLVSKIYNKTKTIIPVWVKVKGSLGEPDVTVSKSGKS